MSTSTVEPVFATVSDLPPETDTVRICSAAEKVGVYGTVVGAQKIRALWGIYLNNEKSRATILAQGFSINGMKIKVSSKNPFILRGDSETPSTRLTIEGIPLSYSDGEIVEHLKEFNIKLLGPLTLDRARDSDGKLTRWLTGRRWVWIEAPPNPLPRSITMAPFTESLYHMEKNAPKTLKRS
ncbi:hypothetical protein ElyMa_002981600 [Elysia marginata]|uniref:Uncharacterized protein n=1 Tax=Elysia marginata TaxID=1093978 RepID=A0AAV4IC16_9GAST|nr:hypothetical protein ElyMa_002981600 [Elysia marginata]